MRARLKAMEEEAAKLAKGKDTAVRSALPTPAPLARSPFPFLPCLLFVCQRHGCGLTCGRIGNNPMHAPTKRPTRLPSPGLGDCAGPTTIRLVAPALLHLPLPWAHCVRQLQCCGSRVSDAACMHRSLSSLMYIPKAAEISTQFHITGG